MPEPTIDIAAHRDVTTYPEAAAYWSEICERELRRLLAENLAGALTDHDVAHKLALMARIGAAITHVAETRRVSS